jgi:hypothetical protein
MSPFTGMQPAPMITVPQADTLVSILRLPARCSVPEESHWGSVWLAAHLPLKAGGSRRLHRSQPRLVRLPAAAAYPPSETPKIDAAHLTAHQICSIVDISHQQCSPSRTNALCSFLLRLFCLAMHPDVANLAPPPSRMRALPSRTLWVWERPENLRAIDPKTTAIATLNGTLVVGNRISVIPRRQFYAIPPGTWQIAVVRMEAPGTIAPNLEPVAAEAILGLASAPDIEALQIDFDTRRSQRVFYSSQSAIFVGACLFGVSPRGVWRQRTSLGRHWNGPTALALFVLSFLLLSPCLRDFIPIQDGYVMLK